MCGLMIITQKLIWFYIPHKRPHTKEKSQHEMFPWWHTAACNVQTVCDAHTWNQHPIYTGKSANMTWHKNDALSKQTVFIQVNLLYHRVNVYKHLVLDKRCTNALYETMKYSRGKIEGLSRNCSLTMEACQWDKWCAL